MSLYRSGDWYFVLLSLEHNDDPMSLISSSMTSKIITWGLLGLQVAVNLTDEQAVSLQGNERNLNHWLNIRIVKRLPGQRVSFDH